MIIGIFVSTLDGANFLDSCFIFTTVDIDIFGTGVVFGVLVVFPDGVLFTFVRRCVCGILPFRRLFIYLLSTKYG